MIHYSFLGYMIASAIVMIVCIMAYRFLLENKVRPSVNRMVLLTIYAISFLIPFISAVIPEFRKETGIEIGSPEFVGFVENISNNQNEETIELAKIFQWISTIYFLGLFLTFFFSLFTVGYLFYLIRKSKIIDIGGTDLYVHDNKKLSSFSWCNKIFLFKESVDSDLKDLKMLISHEKVHLDKGHWLDLAVAQIVLIFQWFNPAAWFMRRELQRIHEYEADETVLQSGVDEKEYQMLLIHNISGNRYSGLTDGLNNCSLRKRIIMMKKTKFKNDWVTRGMAICGFAILSGFIIHIPAVAAFLQAQPEADIAMEPTILSVSSAPKSEESNLLATNEETMKDVTIIIDGKESTHEEMSKLDPDRIENITVYKNPSKIIINLKKGDSSQETTGNSKELKVVGYGTIKKDDINSANDKKSDSYSRISDQPETIAEYEGGQLQLLKDLSAIVVYPEDAKEKNIQGKVVVQFLINTDGTISDCEVASSQNSILNDAALKAVENLPGKWKPAEVDGKPVASVFNMPVVFKLQSSEDETN